MSVSSNDSITSNNYSNQRAISDFIYLKINNRHKDKCNLCNKSVNNKGTVKYLAYEYEFEDRNVICCPKCAFGFTDKIYDTYIEITFVDIDYQTFLCKGKEYLQWHTK